MMQLLISVVNAEEAQSAADGGADIIDVKNPSEGALGANFPHVIKAIRRQISSEFPVSVAIGDAPNKPGATSLAALGAACCGVQFVKVGLYGTKTTKQATFLLKEVCRAVRDHDSDIKIIAAAYADAHELGIFPVSEAPFVAIEAGADGCMIDTAGKKGDSLFSHLGDDALHLFVRNCHNGGLICALAGSLSEDDIPRISLIGPDIIGFRAAACDGDRVNGVIKSRMVEHLKNRITVSNESPL